MLEQDSLIVYATQVAEYMECGIHVSLSRVLYVVAEFRARPSEIWSGHMDKIAQATDYPTIAAVESRVGRRIALLFRETCSRFHRRKCRNTVPHLEDTQDVFCKVTLGEESASRRISRSISQPR